MPALKKIFPRIFHSQLFNISLIIFAIALVPRLLLLSKGPFHYDVVDYLISMRDKVITFHGSSYPLPAFIILALGYLRDWFLPGVHALSLLLVITALTASVACVCIFITIAKLFEPKIALVYALIISFMPAFFSVTTFGRLDHALVMVFLPFAIFYLIRQKRIACAFFTALCIATRPENAIILPAYLIFEYISAVQDKKLSLGRATVAALKGFFILCIYTIIFILLFAVFVPEKRWFSRVVLRFFGKEQTSDTAAFLGFSLSRILTGSKLIFTMMALPAIFAVIGLVKKIIEKDFKTTFLYLTAFLVSFLYLVNIVGFSPRYLILPVFFMCFFASYAAVYVLRGIKRIAIFVILCIYLMLSPYISLIYQRHIHAYQLDFVKFLESITEPNSVFITQDEEIFLRYYSNRQVLMPPANTLSEKEWGIFLNKIMQAFRNKQPVYLSIAVFAYDKRLFFYRFLDDNFTWETAGVKLNENWHGMEIEKHLYDETIFKLIPKHAF